MAYIDNVVNVTITRQTSVPSVASFNDILLAAEFLKADVTPNYGAAERTRSFGSLSAIATAFGTSSDVYYAASAIFAQNPSVNSVKIGRKETGVDGTETWTEALTAIEAYDSEWYGLLANTRTLADQKLIASWAQSNKKLCGISSADANVVDAAYDGLGNDIGDYVKANSLDRVYVFYNSLADGLASDDAYPAEALMGKMFTYDPGEATWNLKTLSGVSADSLTETQIGNADDKNANYYLSIAGVSVTQLGKTGNEYIDVMRGVDWLEATIQSGVFTDLINQKKVPFTDAGIQLVVAAVKEALAAAVAQGIITEDFEVTAPLAANVSATDKGNRLLPDVDFTATLQGAIHTTTITGVVSL